MEELNNLLSAYGKYKNNPSFTSRQKIRKREKNGWLVLQQNPDTGSTFAKMFNKVNVVHFIKGGEYYGFMLNNTIYLNQNFIYEFTDMVKSKEGYYRMVGSIFLKSEVRKLDVSGVEIEYVSIKGEEAAVIRWAGSRYHSGVSMNLIRKSM